MKRADILEAARQAVMKDRAATHGKPENTFGLIAGLWSARLGQAISPAQVTIMLIDLKTARAWGNLGHMDNWVDIAGYAACGGELAGEGGETRTASMAEIDMPEGFWDGAVLMPPMFRDDGKVALTAEQTKIVFDAGGIGPMSPAWKSFAMHCGWQIADKNPPELIHEELERAWPFDGERSWHDAAKDLGLRWDDLVDFLLGEYQSGAERPAPDQSPVAVVDFAAEAKAEMMAKAQDNAKSETPAPSPATEAETRHHASKWTPEMDAKLIGGIAVRVANGMSRTTAAKDIAKEIGMGEKACVVRAQNVLLARVTEAIGLAKNAKGLAADLAKTMAPAKAAPAPKPAPQPLSKRLSTPPHVALNIDMHLAECRAEGWAYADDLHLFEMVVDQGYGMGDVALDMGRDSKAIKDRYDRLTGIYQDANAKWCRKYLRDDVLAALRKGVKDGEGVK